MLKTWQGGTILAGAILLIVLGVLILWMFLFSPQSPLLRGYAETGRAIEKTSNWVETAVAATLTAKVTKEP